MKKRPRTTLAEPSPSDFAIIFVERETRRRETFSLVSDRSHAAGYRDSEEIFTSSRMRAEAVEMALKELNNGVTAIFT